MSDIQLTFKTYVGYAEIRFDFPVEHIINLKNKLNRELARKLVDELIGNCLVRFEPGIHEHRDVITYRAFIKAGVKQEELP